MVLTRKMNLKKSLILLLIIFSGCIESDKSDSFKGDSVALGQWQTKNKNWPHWVMFDSLNNYYRWSFNEDIPTEPTAKYVVNDSIIKFIYPPLKNSAQFGSEESIDSLIFNGIDQNTFTILPLDNRIMSTYIYQRDTFDTPTYADIYIFTLTDKEVDSLQIDISKYRKARNKILEDAFYLFEHSLINYQNIDSSFTVARDGTTYNKFDLGGYGIIYSTNDSTYLRKGFPEREEFQSEIDSFFHFVNRVPSL